MSHLATTAMLRHENEKRGKFLTFALDRELFALEVARAREVLDFTAPTQLPLLPPEILGVINRRGQIVPVVDLRVLFGLPVAAPEGNHCIVILDILIEGEKLLVGAVADAVRDVITLAPAEIEPPPRVGTGLRTEFIQGMGKRGEELVLILDVERIFSAAEIERMTAPRLTAD